MKIVEFFKKPRNLYLSIVAMLIVVFGLSSITFSYYIEDSSDSNQLMKVKVIDTVIQSDDITSDEIILEPNETKVININIISNNDYPNEFKIYYSGSNVTVTSDKEIPHAIDAKSTLSYSLAITNEAEENNMIKLGIVNGYIGETITVEGNEIKN